jgi:hypothetical protein
MDEFFNSSFLGQLSYCLGNLHINILKTKVSGFPVSSNKIDDYIAVLQCSPDGIFVSGSPFQKNNVAQVTHGDEGAWCPMDHTDRV